VSREALDGTKRERLALRARDVYTGIDAKLHAAEPDAPGDPGEWLAGQPARDERVEMLRVAGRACEEFFRLVVRRDESSSRQSLGEHLEFRGCRRQGRLKMYPVAEPSTNPSASATACNFHAPPSVGKAVWSAAAEQRWTAMAASNPMPRAVRRASCRCIRRDQRATLLHPGDWSLAQAEHVAVRVLEPGAASWADLCDEVR